MTLNIITAKKKPIEVSAIKWNPNEEIDIYSRFLGLNLTQIKFKSGNHMINYKAVEEKENLSIILDPKQINMDCKDIMECKPDFYIIKSIDNKYYACEGSIFLETVNLTKDSGHLIKEYVKKTTTITACQLESSTTLQELKDFTGENVSIENNVFIIHTLEGKMPAQPNGIVVKGIKGEYYPISKDVFERTYYPIK